jgi:hypothetical protein
VDEYADNVFKLYQAITGEASLKEKAKREAAAKEIFEAWSKGVSGTFDDKAKVIPDESMLMKSIQEFRGQIDQYFSSRPDGKNPVQEQPFSPESKPAAPGAAAAVKQGPSLVDQIPSLNDSRFRDTPISALKYVQIVIATKLAQEKNNAGKDAIQKIRETNELDLLPVAIDDLVASGAEGKVVKEIESSPNSAAGKSSGSTQKPAEEMSGKAPQWLDERTAESLTWSAFSAVMREPANKDNQSRIQSARGDLTGPKLWRLKEALSLAELVVNSYAWVAGDGPNVPLKKLGEDLLAALKRGPEKGDAGFGVPETPEALTHWNVLDAFQPFAAKMIEASAREQELNLGQLDEIQKLNIAYLSSLRLSKDFSKQSVNESGVWSNYLRQALRARRAVREFSGQAGEIGATAPGRITKVLENSEAAELITSLAAPEWIGAPGTVEPKPDTGLAEFGIVAKARALTEIYLLSGNIQMARDILGWISRRLLAPDHAAVSRGEDEGINWPPLIMDLAAVAAALKHELYAVLLWNLAIRSYWPKRQAGKDSFLKSCSANLLIEIRRIGVPISGVTIQELTESDTGYAWWPAARLVESGNYRTALDEYLNKEISENSEVQKKQNYGVLAAIYGWAMECEARLCNIDEFEAHRPRWREYQRRSMELLADDESSWLRFINSYSSALLALGDTQRAIKELESAIRIAETRELSFDGYLAIFSIRIALARLRETPSLEEARTSAEKAKEQIHRLKTSLKAGLGAGVAACDSAFAHYLGAEWNEIDHGGGMFSGGEAPAPARLLLAEAFVEYAEILLCAGDKHQVNETADEIKNRVLGGYDETDRTGFFSPNRLAYCYPVAASSALQFAAGEGKREDLLDSAIRHRDADLEENDPGDRGRYYVQIFGRCGIR